MNKNIGKVERWSPSPSLQYEGYGYAIGYGHSVSGKNFNFTGSTTSLLSTSDLTRRPSSGTDPNTDKTDDDSIVFERGIPQSLLSSPPQEIDQPFIRSTHFANDDTQSLDKVSEKLSICKF